MRRSRSFAACPLKAGRAVSAPTIAASRPRCLPTSCSATSSIIWRSSPSVTTSERAIVTSAQPAVVFENVSLAFDDHVVLDRISFSVPRGGMTMVLGESGAGKSVVLKLILGLLRPDAGQIFVDGERI